MADKNENLIPQAHKLTVEELSKGGKNCAKSKREARSVQKYLQNMLDGKYTVKNKDGTVQEMSGAELMAFVAFEEGVKKRNPKWWELVRDTAGQKPVDKVVVSEVDQAIMDEVESMMNEEE